MKILVTGANGQLGHDVVKELDRRGHTAIGVGSMEMDITDYQQVQSVMEQIKPDAVIHCAAWTAVDLAEEHVESARLVNFNGTKNIAELCKELQCKMMYISTDYVFSGLGESPWEADCESFEPVNVYGKTKLQGEFAVRDALNNFFIVRTSWVFGVNGNNFVKTMLRLGRLHNQLTVINDQIGTPTYTPDLARVLVDMIETEKYGCYHATNEGGFISWYEFAKAIFDYASKRGYTEYSTENLKVLPVSTAEYNLSKAARPFNSRLSKSKLLNKGFEPLPLWEDALKRYISELELKGTTYGTD